MRSFTALVVAACLAASGTARASGLWLSTNGISPNELRVAIAASPDRTTLWTSLSFDSWPTDVALILPVPPGTMVDFSPDAWFSALDQATAPRIYPSFNIVCPGGASPDDSQIGSCVEMVQTFATSDSIPAVSTDVLADLDAVHAWATAHDMAVPLSVAPLLDGFEGTPFVAVRFIVPPPGGGATQTVRVVMPGVSPKLALSLFDPGDRSPLVTTYLIGAGQGAFAGTTPVAVDPTQLSAGACDATDYLDAEYRLLSTPGTTLTQASSHEVWSTPVTTDAASSFDSIIDSYFQQAWIQEPNTPDPSTCTANVMALIESSSRVTEDCPPAAQGTVPGGKACRRTAFNPRDELAASQLRCGDADDLAVAFADLAPADVWVTRVEMSMSAPEDMTYAAVFTSGNYVEPLIYASGTYDVCPDGTGGGGGSSSASSGGGSCDGDAAGGAAEGCGAAADGLSGLGDVDCTIGAPLRRRSPSPTPLALGLVAVLACVRRRTGRRTRHREYVDARPVAPYPPA